VLGDVEKELSIALVHFLHSKLEPIFKIMKRKTCLLADSAEGNEQGRFSILIDVASEKLLPIESVKIM